MNIMDVIEWIKDASDKVALIIYEWISSTKEKIKNRLNKYYTYEDVLTILDSETGMYPEFVDNWSDFNPQANELFSDGAVRPNREAYYKALIEQLPFCPIYPTNTVPFRTGNTRYNETRTRNHNDITKALFSKRVVDKFFKAQKAIQNCGLQPLKVNFYNDKTIHDMHMLKEGASMWSMYSDDRTIKELAMEIVEYRTDMKSRMEAKIKEEQELTEGEEGQEVDTCAGDNCQCRFCRISREVCKEKSKQSDDYRVI